MRLLLVLACLLPTPVRAEDASFDSHGVTIRYVTEGTGVPVVLIHGWMSDSSMWGADRAGNTKLQPAAGFQVIAMDCRGHGKSDKPHDASKYGPEMAHDVIHLLDHLHLEKAHLVGYSSGSFIAGKVAAMAPERVLSIVYGGQAPLITEAKVGSNNEVEVFAKAVDEGKDLGSYLIAVTPAGKPKPTPEQAKAMAQFLFARKDVKAFALAGLSFPQLEVSAEQMQRCQAPLLFIHGGNESDYVKNRVKAVRQLLGRGAHQVIEGTDHMTTLIHPQFGKTVIEFLRTGKVEK